MHIGSQITELAPFDNAFGLISELVVGRCAPTATRSSIVDLGGGLGIPYREDQAPPPPSAAYAEIVRST